MTDSACSNDSPMDFSRIQDTSDGDKEFEQELFAAYLDDCAGRIVKLREALSAGDDETFRREAHTIKGASANVGTTRLHTIAQELESAEVKESDAIIALISQAESEFERVKVAINAYLGAA